MRFSVVSLPMRDGNEEYDIWDAIKDVVVSLPMRDGNEEARRKKAQRMELLAYL